MRDGVHGLHRKPEFLPAQGQERHPAVESGLNRRLGPRGRHHRRQDGETVPGPRHPSENLPVRGPQGTDAVPGGPVPGPRGLLRWKAGGALVPVSGVDREFADRLGALIRRLAADTPARRVPSAQECRGCDITKEDCPDRIQGGTGRKEPLKTSSRTGGHTMCEKARYYERVERRWRPESWRFRAEVAEDESEALREQIAELNRQDGSLPLRERIAKLELQVENRTLLEENRALRDRIAVLERQLEERGPRLRRRRGIPRNSP